MQFPFSAKTLMTVILVLFPLTWARTCSSSCHPVSPPTTDLWAEFERALDADNIRFEDFSPHNTDWPEVLCEFGFSAIKQGRLLKLIEDKLSSNPQTNETSRPQTNNTSHPQTNDTSHPQTNDTSHPQTNDTQMNDISRRLDQIEETLTCLQFPPPPPNLGPAPTQPILPAVPSVASGPPRDPVVPGKPQAFTPRKLPPSLAQSLLRQKETPIPLPAHMANRKGIPGLVRAVAQLDSDGKNPRVTFVLAPNPEVAQDDDAHYNPDNYGDMVMNVGDEQGDVIMRVPLFVNPPPHVLPPQQYEFVDAVTGQTISDVTLNISNSGGSTAQLRVPENGQMNVSSMHLQPGFSRMQTQVAGYAPSVVKVLEFRGESNSQHKIRVLLSPIINTSTTLQVTLGWAEHPEDLDLHCVSGSRHVYFANKKETNIELDFDVRTGNGPETITITKELNEAYYFSVHHYVGQSSIPESRAWLRVSGAGAQQTFHVSTTPVGKTDKMYLLAFSVRNDVITQKNTFVDESSSLVW